MGGGGGDRVIGLILERSSGKVSQMTGIDSLGLGADVEKKMVKSSPGWQNMSRCFSSKCSE